MNKVARYLVVGLMLGVATFGLAQLASTQSSVINNGAVLSSNDFGNYKVENITVCSGDGDTSWSASINVLDDLRLIKITDLNSGTPTLVGTATYSADDFSGSGLPSGIGPRGYPGMSVDLTCSFGYLTNFFLDSVVKLDLEAALTEDEDGITSESASIIWPTPLDTSHTGDLDTPIDAVLNSPSDTSVYVSESAGGLVVLDAATGDQGDSFSTGGTGAGTVLASGDAWVALVQNSSDIACIDLSSGIITQITGLGNNPFMGVTNGDRSVFYVSNQGSNSVSVVSGNGCSEKSVSATIDVGSSPRHLALSSDDRFLYVSNSTDNSVSIIDTASNSVVETVVVTGAGEPAPIGTIGVSGNNRYVYVYWEGGTRGTPGAAQIIALDVCKLYGQNSCN